jgi:dienelactone hydrolase
MKKYICASFSAIILSIIASNNIYAQLKAVSYHDESQKLNGVSAVPAKALKNRPGVLVLPAWMGITEHAKSVAEKLSALGYHVFVADIYGEGNIPKDTKQASEQAGIYKSDVSKYRTRIKLALEQLIKSGADANQLVVIGYCFGGQGALEAARANFPVKGVVSFHGGLSRDAKQDILPINPKVLILHGADDPFIPEADVKGIQDEMRKAKADWQMTFYANAVHSFTEPAAGNDNTKGAAYNEKADKRSWQAALDFFDELFK